MVLLVRERNWLWNPFLAPHRRMKNLLGVTKDHEKHKNSIRSKLPSFLTGFSNLISRTLSSVWCASVAPASAGKWCMTEPECVWTAGARSHVDMWGTTQGSRRPACTGARVLCTVGTSPFCNLAMSGTALLLAGALPAPAGSAMCIGHNVPWTNPYHQLFRDPIWAAFLTHHHFILVVWMATWACRLVLVSSPL